MIYLDYAATSPVSPELWPSSHLFEGGEKEIEEARTRILELLGCGKGGRAFSDAEGDRGKPVLIPDAGGRRKLIFTSGGTESDNLAVLGTLFLAKREGRPLYLLTGRTEHEAVLQAMQAAETYGELLGVPVKTRILPVTAAGAVSPGTVEEALKALSEETRACRKERPLILVSLMYANNETGVLTELAPILKLCHDDGALVHTDAVQAVGHVPLDLRTFPVDLLSASGHKFGGPKGTGFLYLREGVRLKPMLYGAPRTHREGLSLDTEDLRTGTRRKSGDLRPGTLCDYGILGMAEALSFRTAHMEEETSRIRGLRDFLQEGILKRIPGTHVNGSGARLPGHLNVSFDGVESASLLFLLDLQGIAASGGSACAARSASRSHVLTAMGLSAERVDSAVRFTLGPGNTEEEIRETLRILEKTVVELRQARG